MSGLTLLTTGIDAVVKTTGIELVQAPAATVVSSVTGQISQTLPNPLQAGDLLVACIGVCTAGAPPVSVISSGGTVNVTWETAVTRNPSGRGDVTGSILYGQVTTGAVSASFTAAFSGTGFADGLSPSVLSIAHWTGFSDFGGLGPDPLDQVNDAFGTSTSLVSGSVTPTQTNELVVAMGYQTTATSLGAVGGGLTDLGRPAGSGFANAWLINTAQSAIDASWASGTNQNWVGLAATFFSNTSV